MTEKEILWSKIKLFYNTLSKRGSWYTGLSIKKYLRTRIFQYKKDFNNSAISTGRWSAYCHYSLVLSFKNLLEKHTLGKNSTVLIHPFLPWELVDEIRSLGCKILTLDIEKTTLCFNTEKLKKTLAENKIDLLIYSIDNGLYDTPSKQLPIINDFTVPTMIFVDEPAINSELILLFEKLNLGSVLWNFGDSFLDDELQEISNQEFPTKNWYISWFLETRTRSILEYHLSSSQDYFEPIVEALFYLLLDKYKKKDFKAIFYSIIVNRILLKNKLKKPQEAKDILEEKYLTVFQSAIPDIIFDLALMENQKDPETPESLIHSSSSLQQKVRSLYQFLSSQVSARPEGSLEIPDFFLDKTYNNYFFYTTEIEYWIQELTKRGFLALPFDTFSPEIIGDLAETNFVINFGIKVKLS